MQGRILQKGKARRIREELDVSSRDVADDVEAVVYDSYRAEAFCAHEGQGVAKRSVGARENVRKISLLP
jgi:hypothetical protein